MSSRFTKLFKPSRGNSRRDTTFLKDSDNFSLSVASVSSNSTEHAGEHSSSKEHSKQQQPQQHQSNHTQLQQGPAKDSSNSSLLATPVTSTSTGSVKNEATASLTSSTPTAVSKKQLKTTSLGSSVVVNKEFNDSDLSFTLHSSEDVVLKFTDAQIKLLKWSWNENIMTPKDKDNNPLETKVKINSISETFASSQFWNQIYSNVYLIDPELKKILPAPDHQTVFFTGIIRMAVLNVGDLTVMNDYLRSIGRRHGILFGAEPAYFQTLGIAIIRALNDKFGDDFSPELEHVWILLYCYISNTMVESCSVDPVMPEDVLVGIVSTIDKTPGRILIDNNDPKTSLSKKRSMLNTQQQGTHRFVYL